MTSDEFFKRIETQYNNQLPFAAYRKPRESELKAVLQTSNQLYFTTNLDEIGFVFAPFDSSEASVLMPLVNSECINASLANYLDEVPFNHHNLINEEEKKQHINLVNKGVEAIKEGVIKKVVLSRKEEVLINETNPINFLKKLLSKYTASFVYCWYHPKVGLWLGATPETLVKIEGNQFSIMALAGTQNYNGSLDVVWNDKEIQEQKFVTDFIVESIKPATESLKISATETVKAGNLVHLKTMVSARLKTNTSLNTLIKAIHPTPAVCGLPKDAAKQFILKNEHYKRAFYTGFLGELNFETTVAPRSGNRNIENKAYSITKKCTQLYVNLRCMQLKNSKASIYVGGGITVHSIAESEWEETVAKSLVIKNVL